MNSVAVTIGVLHPGQMGAAIARQARRKGARVLWCPAGRSQATHDRARRVELEPVASLAELLGAAEIVLSSCAPAAAQQVAIQVAQHGFRGLYIEANGISPRRCARIAERLEQSGAQVLDAAVFPPPRPEITTANLYIAGQQVDIETVIRLFDGTAVVPVGLEGGIGAASALKMAYDGYQKASRVVAAVSHALAARHGVTQHLVTEARQAPDAPLAEPDRLLQVAAHAERWTSELQEIADSFDADELPTDLALAAAGILFRWHKNQDNGDVALETVLARLTNPI